MPNMDEAPAATPEPPNASSAPPPLSDDDEALLHAFAHWLHDRDTDDASPPPDLVIGPSPPPLAPEVLDAAAHASRPRGRPRWLRTLVSHGAVAAATVAAVQVWSSLPMHPEPTPMADYSLALHGGDGQTFAPSSEPPSYGPDSAFVLELRPDRAVRAPTEVVISACREGSQCDAGVFRVRLGPKLLEIDERGVLRYVAPTSSVLPLAPGRWTLTFEVGEPGTCLLSAAERSCHAVGQATVRIGRRGGGDAP